MLVFTRKVGQSVDIGQAKVKVTWVKGGYVKLGIEAPKEIKVLRSELKEGKK